MTVIFYRIDFPFFYTRFFTFEGEHNKGDGVFDFFTVTDGLNLCLRVSGTRNWSS